ncbi:MAG: SMC-Scp complex subunit ScpB [Microscillaceae bacterium]|nr:SMC-Scp complex subunit ScpB [Microscillaceae bacterium]MDW8461511.1 SMC-Scp complex subunit ScpB [Cytophagales bacterium]
MTFLEKNIESLIFCAPEPITLEEIQACISEVVSQEVSLESIREAVEHLIVRYQSDNYSFQIYKIAGGYQFLTKPAYQTTVAALLKNTSKQRLSKASLETLSIIAYKQPITKAEVENIRGINCDYTIQKLLERDLIEIKGKAQTAGSPLLYGTTSKFMEYFGINNLGELPQPKTENTPQGEYLK